MRPRQQIDYRGWFALCLFPLSRRCPTLPEWERGADLADKLATDEQVMPATHKYAQQIRKITASRL
jgi:hypothetical protein